MSQPIRNWPELEIGETFNTSPITISKQDILDFAADFDPQPYHLNSEAAADSIFGGLCASGWHVTALMMRLLSDCFIEQGIQLLGSTAVPQLRWRIPVYADDSLRATIRITEKQALVDEPRYGLIVCDVEVFNQNDKSVIVLSTNLMIAMPEAARG